jgi:hypothetical protein
MDDTLDFSSYEAGRANLEFPVVRFRMAAPALGVTLTYDDEEIVRPTWGRRFVPLPTEEQFAD